MTFGSYSVMLFATTEMHTVYIKLISNPLQILLPLLRSAMLPVCLVSFNSTVTRMQSFRTIIILKLRNYHLNRTKFSGMLVRRAVLPSTASPGGGWGNGL